MVAEPDSAVDIDEVHSAAICKEIGQRLDRYYNDEISEAPKALRVLLTRLQQLDRQGERDRADPAVR